MVIVPINIFDSCNQRKFKLITTETLERYREIKKKINGSQTSGKLYRARRSKLRPAKNVIHTTGGQRYYKGSDFNQWKGLRTIIYNQERKFKFTQHNPRTKYCDEAIFLSAAGKRTGQNPLF